MFEAALAGEISYGQNMSVPRVQDPAFYFVFKDFRGKLRLWGRFAGLSFQKISAE